VKAVIQHVENIKETLKGVLKEFAEVMDGLKVIEKEKRATDKEIESVREKLREIQAVRI
jgi:septation ring formation regulator EzrA